MTVTPQDVLAGFTACQPLFTALGDERRQEIIIVLLKAQDVRSVGEIAAELELSQPAISHHLKILRDAELLTVQRKGTQRLYGLNTRCAELLAPMKSLVDVLVECRANNT